jgi:hypothetical protein
MIVVNPENTEHSFKVIPRYYSITGVIFELYNEVSKQTETIDCDITSNDGIMTIEFEKEFTEQEKFQIKLKDNTGVIFRGKLIATSQTPQNYKQTNNIYVYE